MNSNDDNHFAYNVLAKELCNAPYIQHEFWGTRRGFTPDSILGSPDFIVDGVPNQVRTGDEGTTIPSVAATL